MRQIQREMFQALAVSFHGTYAGLSFLSFQLHWPILGSLLVGSLWRGLAAYKRPGWFWLSAGIAFCVVCHLSTLAAIIAKIRVAGWIP